MFGTDNPSQPIDDENPRLRARCLKFGLSDNDFDDNIALPEGVVNG